MDTPNLNRLTAISPDMQSIIESIYVAILIKFEIQCYQWKNRFYFILFLKSSQAVRILIFFKNDMKKIACAYFVIMDCIF